MPAVAVDGVMLAVVELSLHKYAVAPVVVASKAVAVAPTQYDVPDKVGAVIGTFTTIVVLDVTCV